MQNENRPSYIFFSLSTSRASEGKGEREIYVEGWLRLLKLLRERGAITGNFLGDGVPYLAGNVLWARQAREGKSHASEARGGE